MAHANCEGAGKEGKKGKRLPDFFLPLHLAEAFPRPLIRQPIPLPNGSDRESHYERQKRERMENTHTEKRELEYKLLNLAQQKENIQKELQEKAERDLELQEIVQRERSEIAEKNARELIEEEEEQAKLKILKKKTKKERQKQKKRDAKQQNSKIISVDINKNVSNGVGKLNLNHDLSSPPTMKKTKSATNKKAEENPAVVSNTAAELSPATTSQTTAEKPLTTSQTAAEQLATTAVALTTTSQTTSKKTPKNVKDLEEMIDKALELIESESYREAIKHLSDAIILAPTRADLILKRSFVYYELGNYKKSLRDAEDSLKIVPFNPEGHFRLGEAHFALKNNLQAEAAFSKIMHNLTYSKDAREKLFNLRIKQLTDMGYKSDEAFTALLRSENYSLEGAIDNLTNPPKAQEDYLYFSDTEEEDETSSSEEEEIEERTDKPHIVIERHSPILKDPENPFHCVSLYVLNMKEDVTAKEVQDAFIEYGEISSIKLFLEPSVHAFINYKAWQSASRAMEALQGSRGILSPSKGLLLKYPISVVNQLVSQMENVDSIIGKLQAEADRVNRLRQPPSALGAIPKQPQSQSGRVNGQTRNQLGGAAGRPQRQECYYWRTSGCHFGYKCYYRHVPEHKGIALGATPASQH